MPTLVCFGDRIPAIKNENQSFVSAAIREQMTSWVVIDSTVYGRSSREGMTRFQDDVLMYNPDLVTIMFGMHDASTTNFVPIQEYKANLRYMVNKLSPKKTILVSPVPLIYEKQMGMNALIRTYVKEMENVAHDTGTRYVNLWQHAFSESVEQNELHHILEKKLIHQLLEKEEIKETKKNLLQKFNLGISRVL
ncbi:SGNH/GDSL hydrolase family protein [Pueribacillus sp. YX66]|uniref:SGNH/GDSL hydrolase family protein n=1 Tax=Pueribacillus sp. YX66 TaxID=3229242 RepID=UPI00358D3116